MVERRPIAIAGLVRQDEFDMRGRSCEADTSGGLLRSFRIRRVRQVMVIDSDGFFCYAYSLPGMSTLNVPFRCSFGG